MDIDGLGDKLVELMVAQGLIESVDGLYSLTLEQICGLDRMAEKSAKNLLEALENSKHTTLPRFIYALGILGIGETMAATLAREVRSLDKIRHLQLRQLIEIRQSQTKNLYAAFRQFNDLEQGPGDLPPLSGLAWLKPVHMKMLSEKFDSVGDLLEQGQNALANEPEYRIDGLGFTLAEKLVTFFHEPHNNAIIDRLLAAGIEWPQIPEPDSDTQVLAGKTFVITGTLENYSRQQASEQLKLIGAKVSSSVSVNTTAVIAGEKPGSKVDKALKLGVEVLDEAQFEELLKG
jgi:DNA ligase (NAD+)